MSNSNKNKEAYQLNQTSLLCEIHQMLKKYYIVNENRFVCEYDGEELFTQKTLHLNQIIDQNYHKIPQLIDQSNTLEYNSRVKDLLPAIKEILNRLCEKSSNLLEYSEKYNSDIQKRISNLNNQAEKEYAKEVLSHIPLNANGKPDTSKVMKSIESEKALVALGHLLVQIEDESSLTDPKKFTESLTKNIENVQLEAVGLIRNLLDLINISYDSLIEEVAKCESKTPDRRNRYLIQDTIMSKEEHDNILTSLSYEYIRKESILNNNFNNILEPLTKECENLKKLNKDINNNLYALQNTISEKDSIIKRLQMEKEVGLDGDKHKIRDLQAIVNGERENLKKFELENEITVNKLNTITKNYQDLLEEYKNFRDLQTDKSSKSNATKARIFELEQILIEVSKENDELKKLTVLPQEIAKLKETYEAQIAKLNTNNIMDLRKINSEKDKIIDDLKNEISDLKNNNNSINQLVSSSRDDSMRKIGEYEYSLNDLKNENADFKKKIEELNLINNNLSIQIYNNKDENIRRIRELELELLTMQSLRTDEIEQIKNTKNNLTTKFDKEKELLHNEIKKLESHIEELENEKIKNNYLKKISNLENDNNKLGKELEILEELSKSDKINYQKKHTEEISKLNDHYSKIIDDLNNNINNEKLISKRIGIEKDQINPRINELLLQLQKSNNENVMIKTQYENRIKLINKDLQEINLSKEKLLIVLEEEREKYDNVINDNTKLCQIKNEADILILELRERLQYHKLDEEKKSMLTRNQENGMTNLKQAYEKKIIEMENNLKDNESKHQIKLNILSNQMNELYVDKQEAEKLKNDYLDRIHELEKEIFELRNTIKNKDFDFEQANSQINDLKIIIEKIKENNYQSLSTKNKENKLVEAAGINVDFSAVKEVFQKRINSLENELEIERENLKNTSDSYECKLNENSIIITQLGVDRENLIHQLEFLKTEFDKEKNNNSKKVNDLNDALRDLSKSKDKNKEVFNNERTKMNLVIINLEKEIKDLRFAENIKEPEFYEEERRVKELEEILLEERNRIDVLIKENSRLEKGLSDEVNDIIKQSEINKRKIFELNSTLNDEKAKNNHVLFEIEILKSHIAEKEETLENLMEESKNSKLHDDKLIKELINENKELRRQKETLEKMVDENEQLTSSGNPNLTQANIEQEKIISDLYRKYMQIVPQLEDIQNENLKLKENEKNYEEDLNNLNNINNELKHENEALKVHNNELANYDEFYSKLKSEYEKVLENNEIFKRDNKNLEADLVKEKTKYSFLNNNSNQKLTELHCEIEKLNNLIHEYGVDIEQKDSKIKQMEAEINLLKSKLDSQYNELNLKKESPLSATLQLEEARKYKEKIESELNDKKRRLTEAQYEIDQLKNQNKEQKIIIDNLKKKLPIENDLYNKDIRDSLEKKRPKGPNIVNQFYEEMKKTPYYRIDFDAVPEPQFSERLLLNQNNWQILKPWLANAQNNSLTDIKLNLIYKATRDGFSHKKFKERCRKIAPTVIVVHTSLDKLIGGFTTLRWDMPRQEQYEYVSDNQLKTFLFSLSLEKVFKIKPEHKDFAICNSSVMGPIFGAGSDLEIPNDCDKNSNNYSGIGKSFDYKGDPILFYGALKYYVKDYEVYECVFEN